MRKLAILGSTGSIGTQALDVAARHSDRFAVTALVAHSSSEKLFEQVRQFHPQIAALSVEPKEIPADIRESCQWMFGENVLLDVVRACDADDVLVSVVGVVGLAAVMEALACGKRVLLANKEPLVAGGELEDGHALVLRLGHAVYPRADEVLAQQHAEHRRRLRVLVAPGGEVQPGHAHARGDEELLGPLPRIQRKEQQVPCGLLHLVYVRALKLGRKFVYKCRKAHCVKRHRSPP